MEEMVGNEVEKNRDRMYGSEAQRSKQHGDTSLYSFKNTTKEGNFEEIQCMKLFFNCHSSNSLN